MRVPTPDDGPNNAAYWRKRAEDAEAVLADLRRLADSWAYRAQQELASEATEAMVGLAVARGECAAEPQGRIGDAPMTRYALCVGINYPGTSYALQGCVNDA